MTQEELQYLRRALEVLETNDCTPMARHKILRTMEQVCGKNATLLENELVDRLEEIQYNIKTVKGATYA